MKPDPCSPTAIPYASAAPATGMTCRQVAAIRSCRPAWITIPAISRPGADPGEHAEPELLEQQRARAAPAGDLGLDVGDGDGREQQRDADPVVEPALEVEPLADRLRDALVADDGLAERRVGRREHDAEDHRLPDREHAEDRGRGHGSERDRQRQADAEQPERHPDAAAQPAGVDPRGVAEQHERERSLRERAHDGAGAGQLDAAQRLRPDEQPERDEHHRGRQRRCRRAACETAATPSSANATSASAHSIR